MMAEVVEPVGRKANWSLNVRLGGGGLWEVGLMKDRTTVLSIMRVSSDRYRPKVCDCLWCTDFSNRSNNGLFPLV